VESARLGTFEIEAPDTSDSEVRPVLKPAPLARTSPRAFVPATKSGTGPSAPSARDAYGEVSSWPVDRQAAGMVDENVPPLPVQRPLPRFSFPDDEHRTTFTAPCRNAAPDTGGAKSSREELTSIDVYISLDRLDTTRSYPSVDFEEQHVAQTLPCAEPCHKLERRGRLGDCDRASLSCTIEITTLEEDARAEDATVYYELGCTQRQRGEVWQAINSFEKALAIDDAHRATLEAIVEIYAAMSDWKRVCAYKRQLLDCLSDADQRFLVLNEVGDIRSEKEKNHPRAIDALEEALEIRPDDHVLLHKLLWLHQQTNNYDKMIDTIRSISKLEANPERKARYLFTMAQLYRDQQRLDRAVELFNESLDLNPDLLEAFERIDRILRRQQDWRQLERSFRKMICRMADKGKTDIEYALWCNLGMLYRDQLAEAEKAEASFRIARRIKPEARHGATDPGGCCHAAHQPMRTHVQGHREGVARVRAPTFPRRRPRGSRRRSGRGDANPGQAG
ncbi:MAG: tetratricopeptide repeat protein, partial [Polyangiaceae bacterium]|nr:tetratricopeptide repeat protein [Polyangiaceae bacterium]